MAQHPNSLANLIPFKKGEAPIPTRRTVGASITMWCNALTQRGATEKALLRIMRGKKKPIAMRIAANRLLAMMERADLADFEPLIDGQVSLRELRRQGVDTAQLKKWQPKRTKTIRRKEGEEEIVEEVTESKIELFDRSLDSFEKTLDRTDGPVKPAQEIQVNIVEVKLLRGVSMDDI